MSILDGKNAAVTLAKSSLEKANINKQCDLHGFQSSQNGEIPVRLFGKDALFCKSNLNLLLKGTIDSVRINQHILFLHYLLCNTSIMPSNQFISFRQLPGGKFYWNPFLSKTIKPLVNFIGNDIEKH